ncbi:MAG TPA: NAD-dependent epimerase/dehydratase family protein [Candidatus Eisenbacteria bacterium]|nr:NAD-dependent epimerase/dehydratase family protein [Candidatus Eisenbacteria bacterium]
MPSIPNDRHADPRLVLVTGGAGFIGSHVTDALIARGARVRVLDALVAQVHGHRATRPEHLHPRAELRVGDVRDPVAVRSALEGVSAVVHLAARVGVRQSRFEIAEYVSANTHGTAVLLEALAGRPIRRLVVASSMSIYGEGLYVNTAGRPVERIERTREQLARGEWNVREPDGEPLRPRPTPESKAPAPSSVYALSKYDQERLALLAGATNGIPTVVLRLFNVYGPRQALFSPYTGVLAAFAARLLNGSRPLIYEDGRQLRDFVHVRDVARACLLALERPAAPGCAFNVASGRAATVSEIATRFARALGRPDLTPEITGRYRVSDIRHCTADLTAIRNRLGYAPEVSLDQGLEQLSDWLAGRACNDHAEEAVAESRRAG